MQEWARSAGIVRNRQELHFYFYSKVQLNMNTSTYEGIGKKCRNRQELAGSAGIGRNRQELQQLQQLHFHFYSKV